MEIIIIIGLFIIGLILGSFYLVVASRLPIGESITKGRSHCEFCKHPLAWYELIPLISYIFLLGKCKKCKKHISFIYPFTELITGILFSLAYILYGFSFNFWLAIILFSLVIIIFISDFKYYIILDSPLVISSILIFIIYIIYFNIQEAAIRIIFGIVIFLFLLFIKLLGDKIFKRESLGGGDIKLGFVIGLLLGIKLGFVALILSAFLALPYAITCMYLDEEHIVPFGPFMISATAIVFIFMLKFNMLIDFLTF